jgi:hypothetical protein
MRGRDRSAAAMTDDNLIFLCPAGHRYSFVVAAMSKRWIATEAMSAGERLWILEKLHGLTDGFFTQAALAMIEPADDFFASIFEEAKTADPGNDCSNSFEILTSQEVFNNLARLNPSILKALRVCPGGALSQSTVLKEHVP